MLVKWLWVSIFKTFASPALLPIVLATFVSVTGPGGFAEIGRDVTGVPTIAVVPEAQPVPDESPAALLVRAVHEDAPVVAPAAEPDVAPLIEVATDASVGEVDETAIHIPVEINEPPATDGPPTNQDEPVAVPSTPEAPVDDSADDGTSDDGAGDAGDGGDPPVGDDTQPGSPPEDDEGAGEDIPGDDDADDGSDGSDEPVCDPPGTGPEPHEGVPPGHDQNGDGIDDRCQDTESDGQDPGGEGTDDGSAGDDPAGDGAADEGAGDEPAGDQPVGDEPVSDEPVSDEPISDEPVGDDGAGEDAPSDSSADRAECDPPGNGHDNQGTPPPGHDKNEDGIDDRCQEFPEKRVLRIEAVT